MTQKERILRYMDDFGSITPFQAFADLGITKLSTRVGELVRSGVEISREEKRGVNRYGEPTHWMEYRRA